MCEVAPYTIAANIDDIRAVKHSDGVKWPIVYSDDYNISFVGLERQRPFGTHKYGLFSQSET